MLMLFYWFYWNKRLNRRMITGFSRLLCYVLVLFKVLRLVA